MNIHGNKIILRAIEDSDLPQLHQWANDPEIWDLLDGWHFPSSRASLQKWFENLGSDPCQQRFAIEAEDRGLIGTANLVDIDWKNKHAFHGMMIGENTNRRKGYGSDTIHTITRFAFEELNLHRLETAIIEYNHPSLHTYTRKMGWREEGRLRQWYFRKNQYWDRILVGILKEDYLSQCPSGCPIHTNEHEGQMTNASHS